MAVLADDIDLVPALALGGGDDADVGAVLFEDRALLDVQLEEGVHRPAADLLGAGVADPIQFLADRLAVEILDAEGEIEREGACEHARGGHRRCEARAFLVGPHGDLDRMPGLDPDVVQRAHDFERRQDAENAVELAAGRLRVEMTAGHHWRQLRIGALAAREHVADLVDLDRAAGGLAPFREQVAALAVEIRQRLAVAAALGGGADLGHFHQAVPQAGAVDREIAAMRHGLSLSD